MKTTRAEKVVFGVVGGLIAIAALAAIGKADAATVPETPTVTPPPPPSIAKALASVTHQYCQMTAQHHIPYFGDPKKFYSQNVMKRYRILGKRTALTAGVQWPISLQFQMTCAANAKDLHLYNESQYSFVKGVRRKYHVPVYTEKAAFDYCAKKEGIKAVYPASPWQMFTAEEKCLKGKAKQ